MTIQIGADQSETNGRSSPNKIKRFVQTKELPEHRLHRSLIKNHGPSCFIENGLLKYHDEQPGKLPRDLIVLPEDHTATVAESHSSLEGGHEGPEKNIDRIKKTWW